jgi:hypothetical protein
MKAIMVSNEAYEYAQSLVQHDSPRDIKTVDSIFELALALLKHSHGHIVDIRDRDGKHVRTIDAWDKDDPQKLGGHVQ